MNLVTLDFESFWSATHSLSKMAPTEYVMHPDTEVISCSVKVNKEITHVYFGEAAIREAFSLIEWEDSIALGHNMSGFDSMILAWRFGIRPRMWACTAAMARPIYAKTCGVSLAALVKELGVGVKDNAVLLQTKGRNLADFTAEERVDMQRYNREDTEQCYKLFQILRKQTSAKEMMHIHLTTQMLVNPQFELDMNMLEMTLDAVQVQKRESLVSIGKALGATGESEEAVIEATRAELASAAKFSLLLEKLGEEVPMKLSPTPNKDGSAKYIPALSKTDEAFIAMQEHDNPLVAAAATARLGVKSTLLETRLGKFIRAGAVCNGFLPVPLRYYGADTTGRWSGEQYNCMSAGHELLTPSGWVAVESWLPATPIMQWWPDGSLTWCTEAKKYERWETAPLVELDAPFVRGRFTSDHRMVHFTKSGRLREKTAGEVLKGTALYGVPAAGHYSGPGADLSDSQLRLLVAASADATVATHHIRFGFRKQRKIDRLKEILSQAGVSYLEFDYRDKPDNHCVITIRLAEVGHWLRKGFGDWVLSLSASQLDVVLSELPFWDGMSHSRTGNMCFFTSLRDQADWVATMSHLRGLPARVGRRERGSNEPPKYDVYTRSKNSTSVTKKQKKQGAEGAGEMVYCPSVESSYVLVRFNGAIHVTGNCQNLPAIRGGPKLSDALRMSLCAPKGKKIIVADLSGIELRVNHFLWKVPYSTKLYREDPTADLYTTYAALRYGVPESEVTKSQRQLAKLCLVEGTQVLTEQGYVSIEDVTNLHKVWDGVEWVGTLGAIYKGEQDVISYDGLTATPDHEVWVEDGRKISLQSAAAQLLRVARTGASGLPLGFSGLSRHESVSAQGVQARAGSLLTMSKAQADELQQPDEWGFKRMSELQPEMRSTGMATTAHGGGKAAVYQPERPELSGVRSQGDSVQVPFGCDRSSLGSAQSGATAGLGDRSSGQQWPLRTGQPSVRDQGAELYEPKELGSPGVSHLQAGPPRGEIRGQHVTQSSVEENVFSGDRCPLEKAVHKAKRRVWDLLNCGPRHRFTANDRLVSNCHLGLGFGAGAATFKKVAKTMGGLLLSDAEALEAVTSWRSDHKQITNGWRKCHDSLEDIVIGRERAMDPWGLCTTAREGILLPSKRLIRYPDLRVETDPDSGKPEWWYGHGRHRARIYAGKIVENLAQSLARDVIADNMLDFFKQTRYEAALAVHDELVYVVPEDDAEDLLAQLQAIMRTPPTWWPELVTWSEGDIGDRYGEAK